MASSFFSIFGQVENVVAEMMVKEGKITRIEPDMIPATVRWRDDGRKAFCAVVFPSGTVEREFNRRVMELR